MRDFRDKFREYLVREGIAQVDAAEAMGITQQAISNMLDPQNDSPVRPTTVSKAMNAYPGFRFFAEGRMDPDIGKQAADNFELLMKTHPYFRSKVVAHGKQMLIEYLESKQTTSHTTKHE